MNTVALVASDVNVASTCADAAGFPHANPTAAVAIVVFPAGTPSAAGCAAPTAVTAVWV